MESTKIYKVEFVEYTNALRDTVSNGNDLGNYKYIKVSKEGFLVREEHLNYISQYGKGIKNAILVGELFEPPIPNYKVED